MIHMRKALVEEAHKLSNIAIKSKAHWNYSKEFIRECLEDLTINKKYIEDNHVYVLESNGDIAGFFTFVRGKNDSLDFLYVHPDFLGKGFGKVLWDNAIEKAREIGIESFIIDSDPNAESFYKKMGAELIGETPSTVFKNRTLPLMKFIIDD